jgi:hypothetical protein
MTVIKTRICHCDTSALSPSAQSFVPYLASSQVGNSQRLRIFGTATDRLVLSRPEMIYSLTNRA